MKVLIIIAVSLLIVAIYWVLSLHLSIEVLEQPDGKYLIIWYNVYTKKEVKREHKIIKL